MITVRVNKKNDTVTYSTLINVDGKLLSLKNTKYLYYAKPYHLNQSLPLPDDLIEKKVTRFEEAFYWPEECYTNPKRNHFKYHDVVDSNYKLQNNKDYINQWEEIFVRLDPTNKNVLLISNDKDTMYIAIPPNTPGVERYDYVTDDGMFHYNCNKGEHRGIEIYFNGSEKILSW